MSLPESRGQTLRVLSAAELGAGRTATRGTGVWCRSRGCRKNRRPCGKCASNRDKRQKCFSCGSASQCLSDPGRLQCCLGGARRAPQGRTSCNLGGIDCGGSRLNSKPDCLILVDRRRDRGSVRALRRVFAFESDGPASAHLAERASQCDPAGEPAPGTTACRVIRAEW